MSTNLTIFIVSDIIIALANFYDLISSQLELMLIFGITILGAIILMSKRLGDKILKGLQGTAATTIITIV
jgi:hypothetical protein